ncbi:MAG TPA: hypothetical protein GXX70_05635 [Tepidimicrobium sp.]|nr:hypothetical protein [Tepidimicrobium sp.]
MNKILLINRLDPQKDSDTKDKVFFMIGDMNKPSAENRLIDVLNRTEIISCEDIVLKYNGVELDIKVQHIPKIVKKLVNEDFDIYGIYQLYNPEE